MKHRISNGVLATIIIVVAVLIDQILKLWVKTSFFYGEETASALNMQAIPANEIILKPELLK